MFSNRVHYRDGDTRIELAGILPYISKAKAPYVAVPVVEDGSRRAAVFIRSHLKAAIESNVLTAIYSSESYTLTLNGGKSKYVLKDIVATGHKQAWQVQEELVKWATSKRKAVATKRLPAHHRRDAKRRAEIAKLEKQLGKLYLRPPHNPALNTGASSRTDSRSWHFDAVNRWESQRAARKALAGLYAKYYEKAAGRVSARFPWKDFYADVNALGETHGFRLDPYNHYQRVRTRVAHKGIFFDQYLRELHVFCSLEKHKPFDMEPLKFAERRDSYLRDRESFLSAIREAASIREQIANLKDCMEPLVLVSAQAF
jgi:hypothetical protein